MELVNPTPGIFIPAKNSRAEGPRKAHTQTDYGFGGLGMPSPDAAPHPPWHDPVNQVKVVPVSGNLASRDWICYCTFYVMYPAAQMGPAGANRLGREY